MKNYIRYLFLVAVLLTCAETSVGQSIEPSNFEKEQDSLRIVLVQKKENKALANSVFQELYIRDNIKIKSHSIFFYIQLDLHFWDCGAPDSYSHLLNFSIPLDKINNLPKKLFITETKIEPDKKNKVQVIEFELLQSNVAYCIFHSEKYRKSLIVFKSGKKTGTSLYYFQNLSRKKIRSTPIYKLIENGYKEDDAPWHSKQLQIEYESFL